MSYFKKKIGLKELTKDNINSTNSNKNDEFA